MEDFDYICIDYLFVKGIVQLFILMSWPRFRAQIIGAESDRHILHINNKRIYSDGKVCSTLDLAL